MTHIAPKPGPHLHLPTNASDDPARPMFRELAKRHAAAASDYLLASEDAETPHAREELLTLADIAANVSIACSHIAPPARFRYVHRTDEK